MAHGLCHVSAPGVYAVAAQDVGVYWRGHIQALVHQSRQRRDILTIGKYRNSQGFLMTANTREGLEQFQVADFQHAPGLLHRYTLSRQQGTERMGVEDGAYGR